MSYGVQENLLRALLYYCLPLLPLSLGMPTVQALNGITMWQLNWTREGVSGNTPSQPLYVVRDDILKFQCEPESSEFVYLLREDVYNKDFSDACSSSGKVSGLSSLCRPRPIADCRQSQPEKRVDGANETAYSCSISSFIPGMSYYLTSFPSSGDTCLFSLPLHVCPLYDPDCPPSKSPSPSPVLSTIVSSSPPLSTTDLSPPSAPESGSGLLLSSAPVSTSLPSPSTPVPTPTADSASSTISLLTLIVVCTCTSLTSLLN